MNLSEKKQLVLYMLLAYTFSVLVRLIWVYQFSGTESFMWNDQLMINTNDGYVFAETARDILSGTLGYMDGINNDGAVGFLTAIFAKILPFDFETIILYMPTFLGSLLVVPIVLIGYTFKNLEWGVFAAAFGAVVWSYYNRTMTGYYDSDMLNIVTPMLVLWALIQAISSKKDRYLLVLVAMMLFSQWWYPKNIALNSAMLFVSMIYLFLKEGKTVHTFKLISFALITLSLLPIVVKLATIIALFALFHYKSDLVQKNIYYILGGAVALYFISGSFSPIWSSLNLYLVNRFFPPEATDAVQSLHFYGVINTVREASAIPFETFSSRISGHPITFILATVGVVLMMIRYPILLISLPMVAMGFMAYKSGLRFTVYAVPIYALGLVYILMEIKEFLLSFIQDATTKKRAKGFVLPLLMVIALIPNIQHIIGYKVPTVLNKSEVTDLEKLHKLASNDDYTLAWWDYGYPIRYYSDTNTLIDGGKHQNDNYIISKILQTTSPILAVNLAREAVETYEETKHAVVADTLFKDKNPKSVIEDLKEKSYTPPKATRDIYLYLPYRMVNIFPTVMIFGNINLKTGHKLRNSIFYPSRVVQGNGGVLYLANGIIIDTSNGTIKIGKNQKKIYHFDVTQLGKDAMPMVNSSLMHLDGELCVVYMKSYGQIIVMDRKTYESMYVQMFMLGNYDRELFELVVSSPYTKIYKLKK